MLRTFRNALLLAMSLIGAAWIYHWGIAGQDRYSLFDLLQGKPTAAAIAQAAPAPATEKPESKPEEPADQPEAAPPSETPTKAEPKPEASPVVPPAAQPTPAVH